MRKKQIGLLFAMALMSLSTQAQLEGFVTIGGIDHTYTTRYESEFIFNRKTLLCGNFTYGLDIINGNSFRSADLSYQRLSGIYVSNKNIHIFSGIGPVFGVQRDIGIPFWDDIEARVTFGGLEQTVHYTDFESFKLKLRIGYVYARRTQALDTPRMPGSIITRNGWNLRLNLLFQMK